MSPSLPPRTTWIGPGAARRFRVAMWAIVQTATAAGLAWYLTRDVLGHIAPFFAPISAAVCLWATNVVRATLAVEMIVGVGVGILLGTGVHAALGAGPVAMGGAVLLALWAAVTIGQGFSTQRPMFVNQTVMSAILILVFPHGGFGLERLFDALTGGGLAVAFSILIFPKNPLAVLQDARREVLTALGNTLARISSCTGDEPPPDPAWTLTTAAQLHRSLARLADASSTATQLARYCPRRRPLRDATRAADRQAVQLGLLAGSVLHLTRAIAIVAGQGDPLTEPLRNAIRDLAAAGAALTGDQPADAVARAVSARRHTAAYQADTPSAAQVALSVTVGTCADELQRVVGLTTGS